MKKIYLIYSFNFLSGILFAQNNPIIKPATVESKSFDLMLKSMLSFSIPLIGVDELKQNFNDYNLLDTREYSEFKISHLKNAIWVGYENFDMNKLSKLEKNKAIVCYCSVGYRSEKICDKLSKNGFKYTYNLYGSIFEWANKSYPLYSSVDCLTDSIHAYNPLWGKFINNESLIKVYK
ncbi:MAG: rhodanese-like domain-containing protein [Saprospiraceae bacterium]|nr:rhodanese-like domain-containing protein [Saprospiraceae bacterium]MBK7810587.1 rhodanese-like domain-containing protein [Saprospiraceae bacterium]MBK9630178.1 rhodanese-like domain-containing protein [Saprospiraceae bacterium]